MSSRAEQIRSLKQALPSIADRSYDDSVALLDVGIKVNDKVLTLRTELPEAFPQVPPILRILDHGVTHSWLDQSGRVTGLNELYNWDPRTSDLGEVVQRALTEFCTNPPYVNPAVIAANQKRESWQKALPRQPSVRNTNLENGGGVARSAHLDQIAEIDDLSTEELQELLDNDSKLTAFYQSLSAVGNGVQLAESMKQSNLEKARENVVLGTDISVLENEVKQLHREVEESRQRLQMLLSQQRALENPIDPRKLAERFESLARQTDIESEDLAMTMFDGEGIDEAALARFRALRVLFHLRKGMSDRCQATFGS